MNQKKQRLLLRKILAETIICAVIVGGTAFAENGDIPQSAAESRSTFSDSKTAWVKTTSGNLNIRSWADISAAIIGKIPNNAQITVYGSQTNGFYKVSYNGTSGYASASYITFTEPSRTAWAKTSSGNLNIRSWASTSAEVIGKIPNNAQMTVYGNQTNGFYKVSYNGISGYASAAYVTFTKTSGLVERNLWYVSPIKQGNKTCKASAVAQCLNLISGYNKFSTSDLGNSSCKNIDGYVYTGSDGNKYRAVYKTDSYIGSVAEQMSVINGAVSAGLPAAAAVHSVRAGGTQHHWVTIIGKSGNTYRLIDPANGSVTTMAAAGYSFGLADYPQLHYGYVSFTRQ